MQFQSFEHSLQKAVWGKLKQASRAAELTPQVSSHVQACLTCREGRPERKCCGMSEGMPLVGSTISNLMIHGISEFTRTTVPETKIIVSCMRGTEVPDQAHKIETHFTLLPLSANFISGFHDVYHLITR